MNDVEKICVPTAGESLPLPDDPEARDHMLASFAKALGHPARVAIMRILMRRETCVCGEIVDELPLAQSTVSQHLKKLKESGLIQGEVDGPRVCYCVDPAVVEQFKVLVGEL